MKCEQRDDVLGEHIARAFARGGNPWRTAGGIARMLGVPVGAVESYMAAHTDIFARSDIALGGIALYRLRDPQLVADRDEPPPLARQPCTA